MIVETINSVEDLLQHMNCACDNTYNKVQKYNPKVEFNTK